MPELPEAETIVRSLRPHLEGRTIESAEFLARRVSRNSAEDFEGRTIRTVRRYGKQVLFEFDRGFARVKLGMTGALLAGASPGPYTRAIFRFGASTLLFDDIRQFGSIELLETAPADLGPDPLEIDAAIFAERLRERATEAKRALLDQSLVRGLGNIYTDEALFRAGIHPKSRTRRLQRVRAEHLHAEIVALLELAIAHRGSSISDYVDAAGERGGFQLLHRVYGKEGAPCPRCGAPIRRIVVAQRGTHFCAVCQKR
ncbi:MAG: bifunctional DNA-formamidopyrimidine glycosylase/DNA-(apurinic or apyrimidinic site) lyase [Bryobacteraceae bacterium]